MKEQPSDHGGDHLCAIPIGRKLRIKGFDLTMCRRKGCWAIYKQTKEGHQTERWEVIKIQRHSGFTVGGRVVEPAEHYPRAESWGTHGFTCDTYERAVEVLQREWTKDPMNKGREFQ